MGADIHLFIEYLAHGDVQKWYSFGGRLNPGRSYRMFGRLAGVRCPDETHIPPRGLPDDIGSSARDSYYLYISDYGGEHAVTPEAADQWIRNGSASYMSGSEHWVSDPDSHSHSWLTSDEYEAAIGDSDLPEYLAVLAALRSFEKSGHKARVVFWFDN